MAGWFRRPRDGDGVTSGFLGDLMEVFQPSRRHVEAERERRQNHAQLPESGAPPLRVDLDAGVAYLPAPPSAPEHRSGHASATEPEPGPHPPTGGRPARSACAPDVIDPGP